MRNRWTLMEAATDGATGGAGGGAPAAPVASDGAAAPSPAASALASGASADGQGSGGNPADPFGWLPEKHRVLGDDKTLNIEASAKKLAEAYTGLEKRLGDVGMPPKTAEEYKPEGLPESVKVEELMADEGTKSFLKRCHAKGMTNSQVSEVLAFAMGEWAPKLLQSDAEQTVEATNAKLRETWTDDGAFKENIGLAYKAADSIAKKAGMTFEDLDAAGLGNNPTFIRLMASLGPEIGEDASPSGALPTASEEQTIREMEMSEAYRNQKHPQHEKVSAQVRAFYQRKFPGAAE